MSLLSKKRSLEIDSIQREVFAKQAKMAALTSEMAALKLRQEKLEVESVRENVFANHVTISRHKLEFDDEEEEEMATYDVTLQFYCEMTACKTRPRAETITCSKVLCVLALQDEVSDIVAQVKRYFDSNEMKGGYLKDNLTKHGRLNETTGKFEGTVTVHDYVNMTQNEKMGRFYNKYDD